jgi:hypothetical protein
VIIGASAFNEISKGVNKRRAFLLAHNKLMLPALIAAISWQVT